MKQIRKRLTYANVMSSLAVFLVLAGGTAFAASQLAKNSVGSKQLKKNAVTTAKLKANAVTAAKIKNGAITGPKVDLGSLGTVPSATTATNAGNANTVNGQRIFKVVYGADSVSGPAVIFDSLGLTITASCAAGSNVAVTATTSKQNSSIYSFVGSDTAPNDPTEDDLEGGDFDVGDNFNLLAGGGGNINFVHFEYDALDGTVATGTLAVDEAGQDSGCVVTGNVIIG